MSFFIEKQTLDDLNIFGRGSGSLYALFNRTATRPGAERLELMFSAPLSDAALIHKRASIIQFFQQQNAAFIFESRLFDAISLYYEMDERTMLPADSNILKRTAGKILGTDQVFKCIQKGTIAVIGLLQQLQRYLNELQKQLPAKHPFGEELQEMQQQLAHPDWTSILKCDLKRVSYHTLRSFDELLRFRSRERVDRLLDYVYQLDVYISVAKVATERKFVFAELAEADLHVLHLVDCYHPRLSRPVPNSLSITPGNNIIFLTGANMAGKSTFMKSVGIAVFLAHMGFPVPAAAMRFSVRDGMCTTINLPDDLEMGYSHFYIEVLRVKKVSELLQQGKNMMIMFDEMFRGTNVKDAYEATVAVTAGFALKRNSMFIISTHIMEAGETLQSQHDNIDFQFLPALMQGNAPVYPRILQKGITADRHGMIIINNEGILNMLSR